MRVDTVLVTGGAGFVGRHVTHHLLKKGYNVRILDSLVEQVHRGQKPAGLSPDAELIVGDVRDATALSRALSGADAVIHLAAEVGVGQSMYAVERYVSGNDLATAALMESLIKRNVRRVIVASSMSIYGEGLYRRRDGSLVENASRGLRLSPAVGWEPLDEQGQPIIAIPTPEWKQPSLASVYALTKYVQEQLTLTLAGAYGMEGVALRLFNVYGSGQSLSNPYTGVLAIFASRLLNGHRPVIFEDGLQRRDFVHVDDVARAFVMALEQPGIAGEIFNIGSGQDRSVLDITRFLAEAMGRSEITPEISGKGRTGDIRHCFGDVTKASTKLGFQAGKNFSEGLAELTQWVAHQTAVDMVEEARRELEARGLVA
jgi:dTDP-L-rhamnose 4-epimerase